MIESINTYLMRIPLNMIFGACMMFGVFYSTLILIMGGSGDSSGGHHGILGGILGGDGGSGDGGGDGGGGGGHAVHISFLSPVGVTTFLTGFGSMGLISLNALGAKPLVAIFGSGAAAIVLNLIVSFAIYRIFISSQASTMTTTKELIGVEAMVITAIPGVGVGEIAYTSQAGRQTSLARSLNKEPIPKGETVIIVKFIGTAAQVKRAEGEKKPEAESKPAPEAKETKLLPDTSVDDAVE
jgi:membrane protein implicated in regulation of membrane protease activity